MLSLLEALVERTAPGRRMVVTLEPPGGRTGCLMVWYDDDASGLLADVALEVPTPPARLAACCRKDGPAPRAGCGATSYALVASGLLADVALELPTAPARLAACCRNEGPAPRAGCGATS